MPAAKKDLANAGATAGLRSFDSPDGPGDTSRDLPKVEASVKSAKRVFDVLEFFEEHQRSASAIEVANALKFPQSSTSALMTGETIMVAVRNGLSAQYIHVIQAKLPMRLYVKAGTLRPLARSGSGYALLSTYPDREVRRLVRLINANQTRPDRPVDIKALLLELRKVRSQGHAFSVNLVTPGAGVVAMNLPPIAESKEPLVLCVAGLTDALIAQETELAELMAKAISYHLAD